MELLKFVKDYWFLITLVISVATALLYMLVFHVTPWEKYRETGERKQAVRMHLRLGQSLLDSGQYAAAGDEFDASLELEGANPRALEGKRKADLFLKLGALDWKPAEALAYRDVFSDPKDPNILLFLGKLHGRIGDGAAARGYFEQAREAYRRQHPEPAADYVDALDSLGWDAYFRHDLEAMERHFRRFCEIAPYDYRGFHGFGYGCYIKAIELAESEPKAAVDSLQEGTNALGKATSFVPNFVVINMDFGEIARAIDPDFSISRHLAALNCLINEELKKLPENIGTVSLILLGGDQRAIYLTESDDEIAWIKYSLALDHYVKAQGEGSDGPSKAHHDALVTEAEELQRTGDPRAIYDDQKAIVDRLLAAMAKSRSASA